MGVPTALYVSMVDAMLAAMGDYQTDNRGDVGSWVREAAIGSLLPMLLLGAPPPTAGASDVSDVSDAADGAAHASERSTLASAMPALVTRFVGLLAQQANEKIDRLREHAVFTLIDLLRHPSLPMVADHAKLTALTAPDAAPSATAANDVDKVKEVNGVSAKGRSIQSSSDYLAPHSCFPRTVRMLSCATYRKIALHGLAISVGGITESTTKAAGASLLTHIGCLNPDGQHALATDLLELLLEHANTPRVHLPLLRTLTHLLEARALEAVLSRPCTPTLATPAPAGGDPPTTLAAWLVDCVKPSTRSKDVPTLLVAGALLILLLPALDGGRLTDTWRTLLLLLAHRFPKVRKAAADALYVHVLTYGEPGELPPMPPIEVPVDAPTIDEVIEPSMPPGDARLELLMAVLVETAWLDNLEKHAKPARAKLLEALGLPPPKVVESNKAAVKKVEEDLTYKELVAEVGY